MNDDAERPGKEPQDRLKAFLGALLRVPKAEIDKLEAERSKRNRKKSA